MKKSLPAIFASVIFFASCKEKAPFINFGGAISVDTTYVLAAADIPATDPHSVLVEEYTGATCTNCPAAHEILKEVQHAHPGLVNVIGLYIYGPIQSKPPHDAIYDFRDSTATDISNEIYAGVNALPSGGIDRFPVNGSIKLDKSVWLTTIEDRLNVQDSLNLKLACVYDSTTRTAAITATITFTKAVGYPENLSIVVVEDSLVDIQEYPSTDPVYPEMNPNYVFLNIMRGMVSVAPYGDPILPTIPVKEAGRVQVRNYSYKLPEKIVNPSRCRIIAFVNSTNTDDKRILQSAQIRVVN